MRLIDADALKESLKELKAEGNNGMYVKGLQDAIDDYFPQIIDDAPTIDAEPIKHGYWIDKTTWFGGIGKCKYECSNCGYTIDYDPKSRGDKRGGNYCDDCGARMDLKDGADDE